LGCVNWPLPPDSFGESHERAQQRPPASGPPCINRGGGCIGLDACDTGFAADLPLAPRAPTWSWSGFYLGGSAGAAAGTATFSDPEGPSVFGDKVNTAAFPASLQLGYNWQVAHRWVVGLEADAGYLDSNGTYTCMQASAQIIGSNCQVSPRLLASLTGRAGFLVDPLGRTLLYGKGGGAWVDSAISITPNLSFGAPNFPEAPATALRPTGTAMRGAGRWAPASSAL
jgi:opacity protein-like surface antigen